MTAPSSPNRFRLVTSHDETMAALGRVATIRGARRRRMLKLVQPPAPDQLPPNVRVVSLEEYRLRRVADADAARRAAMAEHPSQWGRTPTAADTGVLPEPA